MYVNPAYATLRSHEQLVWACQFRSFRWLVIGYLQAACGHSFEDSQKACDLVMGYNEHYGSLRA
jgi:hypothetical protein